MLSRITEGKTVLVVPRKSIESNPPPTAPVFFNPAASLNRDVSVAITSAAGGASFCDSMAGVGARGIRVAKECKRVEKVVLVDFNRSALGLARKSAAANSVRRKCEFTVSEASSYLYSRFGRDRRFDFVDVDPFGTPVRQVQAAIAATAEGGILSFTATDAAVLCGVHRATCVRRYGATPLNNGFHHETGLRILIGAVARAAASLDIGVEPVASHSTRHYLRAFMRIRPGATAADTSLKGLGYVSECPACGSRRSTQAPVYACADCGKKASNAGPLWVGKMSEDSLIQGAKRAAGALGLGEASALLESLVGVDDFPPWSFSIDEMCSRIRRSTVPEGVVRESLTGRGFRVMRTPYERTGIKTDAPASEVLSAVSEPVGARSGTS